MISRFGSVAWITSLIAAGIALIITIVVPGGYFLISYQYMIGSIDTHAEIAAKNIEGIVMANPDTWKFEEIRLQELMVRNLDHSIPELVSILDSYGNVIACTTDQVPKPIIVHRCDIFDAGDIVGHLEISRSLRPLLTQTGLICIASLLTGIFIFLSLRIIPLRAVRAEQLKIQKIEIQNRQLQKVESLDRMAGAIGHHFNNQLQIVMGNLEMAMDDLPQNSDIYGALTEAMNAARKATEITGMMLTYRGQMSGKREPMDLSEACRQSLTLLQTITPKEVSIKANFPSSGPLVLTNTSQIHLVLTNLLTNAWEAADESHGVIGLTVKTVSLSDIPTSKRFPIDWQPQEGAYACLEVVDTGSGIADKDVDKLFDPFYTTKFIGRGMGLPVVLGIVVAHGGGITIESKLGQGSVFRVFIPVSTEKIPFVPPKLEKAPEIKSRGSILLIDDEEYVRSMAKKMLSRLGYTVLEAKDGVQAVEIFQQHQDQICFVLSDLTMPRMNGWETLAALRKLSPDIPVILSSGYDEAQVMAGEHPERPNAFLGKPYQLKELRETVNRFLSDHE